MSNEQNKRDPAYDLNLKLRELLEEIEDAPVSEELRLAAKKLGDELKKNKKVDGRD